MASFVIISSTLATISVSVRLIKDEEKLAVYSTSNARLLATNI